LASSQEITNVEKDIVALFRRKDSQALRLIDQHYQRALVGVIMRVVKTEAFAQDVWQESLVKIWKNSHTYDPEKGRLFTWLLNICRRTAIDKTRSKVYKESFNVGSSSAISDAGNPAPSESPYIDGIGVREMVKKLDPKYQEVIELAYFLGYSHQEMAQKLDLLLGTVKTRVRKAIKELRVWMGK